jgi:hypothetical protein
MSTQNLPRPSPLPRRPSLRIVSKRPAAQSIATLPVFFWIGGTILAAAQAWIYRYYLSADSVSYLDMSDAVLPGFTWHRLINGVWSPLYPLLLGLFRRAFSISSGNEIAAAHLLNIGVFAFAFLCFDFFLKSLLQRVEPGYTWGPQRELVLLPRWAYTSLAYALFLWASISAISLRSLRPDMLMSGFVYLAIGLLLRMQGAPGRWKDYLALGTCLGIGSLAKAPVLPIGLLVLAISLFLVKGWRAALSMAIGSLGLALLIGSLYFVPLSRARGHLTLGESGSYNYLVHVDRARPDWYLQDPGEGKGSFAHAPEKIFSSPPAYAFAVPFFVTHPLRFDPSYWTGGVRPRFALKRQIGQILFNLFDLGRIIRPLGLFIAAVLMLGFGSGGVNSMSSALAKTWPLWTIGLAGCAMYVVVHLEARYVGVFLVLFWCGLLFSFLETPRKLSLHAIRVATVMIVASLLLPAIAQAYTSYLQIGRGSNVDAQAAFELRKLGIEPGDRVARISPLVTDLGIERTARVEVISEVDWRYAREFWKVSPATQGRILQLFTGRGAKAVIATSALLSKTTPLGWRPLGLTGYWVWLPDQAALQEPHTGGRAGD